MGQPDPIGRSNDRTPSPRSVPVPQGIAEGAESRLRSNSYLALKNISCDFRDGVLTLRGCLPTYYLKQMAQTAVAHMEGVQRIVNEIVVVGAARRSGFPA